MQHFERAMADFRRTHVARQRPSLGIQREWSESEDSASHLLL